MPSHRRDSCHVPVVAPRLAAWEWDVRFNVSVPLQRECRQAAIVTLALTPHVLGKYSAAVVRCATCLIQEPVLISS